MRAQPPPCQPKERPQALPIFSATDKAPHSKYLVAAEDYPTFLFMLRFDVPPALLDLPEGFEPVTAVPWFQIFRLDPEPILKANGGAKSFALPAVNAHALIRLIAKISHAYAVAELGLDAFNSVLPRIVRDKDAKGWRRFVGGALNIEPATNRLHEVSLHFHQKGADTLVVVRVRLFANLGTPTYFVVAGTLIGASSATPPGIAVAVPRKDGKMPFDGWLENPSSHFQMAPISPAPSATLGKDLQGLYRARVNLG